MFNNKLLIITILYLISVSSATVYEANWTSLNARPNPAWYDEVKFGIFIHWGVYSVPAFGNSTASEWYWHTLNNPNVDGGYTQKYHNESFGSKFSYQEFAPMFKANLFDPDYWADVIADSGAKYVVLTSKHHEGYTLWDSAQSWGWNSVNVGPGMDLVGMLSKSIKKAGLHMGLYHSLFEWYNPIYIADNNTGVPAKTQTYVDEILMPQLMDIVNTYEPHVVWADGEWDQPSSYWKSTEFLAWLYTNSSVKDVVVVNDRWGQECRDVDGGFWTGGDKWNPGYLVPHKWENCNTIGFSWGYDQYEPLSQYQTSPQLIQELVSTVSCGGNFLLDVGPTSNGIIPIIMQERLAEIGEWMRVNGEAIYNTTPWRVQSDNTLQNIWYTTNPTTGAVYAISFVWPSDSELVLESVKATHSTHISLLGSKAPISFNKRITSGITIKLPSLTPGHYPPHEYDEVKFGIFIHWGVYSVPAFGNVSASEWYWNTLVNNGDGGNTQRYHNETFGPNFKYQEFAPMFKATLFDPDFWAEVISGSGAKYVVLTSKHHEGFTLWDSPQSWGWNSVNVGPGMDLVGMLSKSIKKAGLHMGLYHSLFEWFNPLYLSDAGTGNPPLTQTYVNDILMPQLMDIVNTYEPHVIWADGEWMQPSSYWKSTEFLAWLYTNSSVKDVVVANDRWGSECRDKDGGFWTGGDHWDPGYLVPHKWENCETIGNSWGYDQFAPLSSYKTAVYLIQEMINTVSTGGNFLLDIGPTSEGLIPPIMQDRLASIGQWMGVNGEAIYNTTPWRAQNDTEDCRVWYTINPWTNVVYAMSFDWPTTNELTLYQPIVSKSTTITLLGSDQPISFNRLSTKGLTIKLPILSITEYPPAGAYTFKLENIS
eukprot:gene2331-2879_t